MLQLESVSAGYGDSIVLRDVNFSVGDGEVVALLGPNGAGKTTLLRTASGFVRPRSGRIEFCGEDLTGRPPHVYTRRGVCHLPEGRGIFPTLTVRENLVIQSRKKLSESIAAAAALFPVLANRLSQTAGSLSGGEQQMLALTRAYLAEPKLVVVDEASLGLAPLVVDKIYEALAHLVAEGMSVVVVEQYVHRALELATTLYILSRGEIIHVGPAKEIGPEQIYEKYLGLE
ncbi:MAG TPA: ABC transporter ATP-binding protein [Acidimicrobiales bacterium]|nr:ABC transporter ATP-binding protein [Acidimicrobiales bacterium]